MRLDVAIGYFAEKATLSLDSSVAGQLVVNAGRVVMAPCKLGSIALLVAISLTLGCSSNSTPTPTSPTTRATVGIAALSVVGERASAGGYTYRVVLHLRESSGVAATISAADRHSNRAY